MTPQGRIRRHVTVATVLAAAGLTVTMLATPASAKPQPSPTPSSPAPSGKHTPKPTPTPTVEPIPPIPTGEPAPPTQNYCTSYDPTDPGDCILRARTFTETITYPDPADPRHRTLTAKVPAIRPMTQIDVFTGPDGKTVKRVSVPSVCAYYRTYTGQRIATYPAPDAFIDAGVPRDHWITNAYGDPKTRSFFQMQLPDGIGKVEAPYHDFYYYKHTAGLTETYDDTIHLDYYNPGAYDDAYRHMTDNTGYWWDYQCSFARYRNITGTGAPEWLKNTLRRLHAENPRWWEFWQPGQEDPPDVPIPTLPLPALLKMVIPGLGLAAAPPFDKGLVSLPQFLYVTNSIGKYPIRIQVRGQTATATPGPLRVDGLPNDAKSQLACKQGGDPDNRSTTAPDACWLQFAQSTPKGQPLKLTFHQDWTITVNNRPVAGPQGTVTKSVTENFTIRQAQAVGGN